MQGRGPGSRCGRGKWQPAPRPFRTPLRRGRRRRSRGTPVALMIGGAGAAELAERHPEVGHGEGAKLSRPGAGGRGRPVLPPPSPSLPPAPLSRPGRRRRAEVGRPRPREGEGPEAAGAGAEIEHAAPVEAHWEWYGTSLILSWSCA